MEEDWKSTRPAQMLETKLKIDVKNCFENESLLPTKPVKLFFQEFAKVTGYATEYFL